MTEIRTERDGSTAARTGVITDVVDGELRVRLHPQAEVLRHGIVRASVISLMVDLVAGFLLDDDPQSMILTTDMSVRAQGRPAPESLSTRCTILRRGRRSATATVDLLAAGGELAAAGAIGFARMPRTKPSPTTPAMTPERIKAQFDGANPLTRPLRDEAAITVVDAAAGIVEMPVTPAVRNASGTLFGAMVALIVEVAAEEMMSTRFEVPAVVTDLDLRFLAQTGHAPVYTKCSLLGTGPRAPIQVEVFDRSNDRLITLAYARTEIAQD